jgi:galactose mutarotase-like enzyme
LDGVLNPPENQDQDILLNLLAKNEHSNLDGQADDKNLVVPNKCSIKDHTLWLSSSNLIELGDPHPVSTGRILDVSRKDKDADVQEYHGLLDFTSATGTGKVLGPGLDRIPGGYGYDSIYALNPTDSIISDIGIQGLFPSTPHVATLMSLRTGIQLDLLTSEPAVVLYTSGYVDAQLLKRTKSKELELPSSPFFISPTATPVQSNSVPTRGDQQERVLTIQAEMGKFGGICLEPIRYPDAIHHRDWAKMVTLHHDQVYRQKSIYRFSVVS